MKLKDLKKELDALVDAGHGDKQVFYRQYSSGDCGPLSYPRVTDRVDECGPFDIADGEEYIELSVGY